MEEILNKDIFSEKDLIKYSPDYNPQDIILRMQLRRETVKGTRSHGTLKNNTQKKNVTAKRSYKVKKEIVKLRTYFQQKNLKNQCILKDVDRGNKQMCAKIKHHNYFRHIENNDLIGEEIAAYVTDSLDDDNNENVNLIIENDSEFKLLHKKRADALSVENVCNKSYNRNVVNHIKSDSSLVNEVISFKENNTMTQENVIFSDSLSTNEYKNDLQSLLIMMTINSTADDNSKHDDATYIESTEAVSNDLNIPMYFEIKNKPEIDETENGELETILKIKPLYFGLSDRQKYILKKYVNLWRIFVSNKREHRMLQQRQETLDTFFDKLAKKKVSLNSNEPAKKSNILARDFSTYRHRYKLQKHIIALQKAKLEEQNKLIEQLKYNNIVEASKQSLDSMREDIRKTYYEIDKHLKPKIKCITNELNLKDFEEPALVLHCLKVPQFIQRMEARAREREEKHAIIRERRKQMEEDRIRMKQQAELAKAEMDKEEKLRRIKELREKRKREKVEGIRKKQHAERLRALIVMADLHYEKNLMAKYGIRPLKLLLEMKQDNLEKAKAHYRFQVQKNVFFQWMWYTEDMWFDRNYKAEDFYRKKILSKAFNSLKKNHYELVLKKQVADDFYDLYITQLAFRKFREGVEKIKKDFEIKWNNAVIYYNSNILFKTFICWRSLPALNALKREQDARKMKWRQKVLLVVPDYKPPED